VWAEPLVWPALATLGFLVLNGLVIALAASSTARFEFGRNQARAEQHPATPAAPEAVPAPVVPAGAAVAADGAELQQQVALSVAAHPAGRLTSGIGATVGWWLVEDTPDTAEGEWRVFAGPFPDRLEADWAALSCGLTGVAVYGVHRPGEGIVLRPSPEDRVWLGELGEHLDRLGDDWDALLSDTDPVTTLAVEVTAALVEAGLALHDCAGGTPAGGVCLTPAAGLSGLLVSWHAHERMSAHQVRGPAADRAVRQTMNTAVADLLLHLGFRVEPLGSAGCHLVTVGQSDP
jgi:hypothetical protein